MKTLVTGPDGLLGSNIVRTLLDAGHEVHALVHPSSRSTTLDGLSVQIFQGDILDQNSIAAAIAGCDNVIHAAASTAMYPPRDPKITTINVDGTRNMLEAAEKQGVKRFVHIGSASSFGFGTMLQPGTEESSYKYKKYGLAYYDSKLTAQKLVLQHVKEEKIDAVVVNPTFMFGPFDSGPSSGRMLLKFKEIPFPVYPPGGRNFADARDVAAGAVAAIAKGRTGECYILGNRNMDMKDFFALVADTVGEKAPNIPLPEWGMLFAGAVGTAIGRIDKNAKPEVTWEIALSGNTGSYYSAAKAIRELGLPQTPVEKALEDEWRWLSDNGYVAPRRKLIDMLRKGD
jgi:dihydroflavonol-4-reductase